MDEDICQDVSAAVGAESSRSIEDLIVSVFHSNGMYFCYIF